jgi:Phosphoinositide 3-kinase C2
VRLWRGTQPTVPHAVLKRGEPVDGVQLERVAELSHQGARPTTCPSVRLPVCLSVCLSVRYPARSSGPSQVQLLAVQVGRILSVSPPPKATSIDEGNAASCLQYRDLPETTQLALTVWEVGEGRPLAPLAGTTMRLFSKKGRLKTGRQRLRLMRGSRADFGWPSATPAKVPVSQRGRIGCAAGVSVGRQNMGIGRWTESWHSASAVCAVCRCDFWGVTSGVRAGSWSSC